MKLSRRLPINLSPTVWFYVNEGSITVISQGERGTTLATIPRRYLEAALAAMRKPRRKLP